MKIQVKAKDLSTAVNTVLAVHDFGDAADDRQPCILTASADTLTLESAKLGAYIIKRTPGKLLREGSIGVNAKDLAGMKLTGNVTIDAGKEAVKIVDSRTKYLWAVDSNAQTDVEEQKGSVTKIHSMAKIPSTVMKAGARFATYKSEVKGDYDVQVTLQKGYFEYCGLDHLSYGRYEFQDKRVRVKQPLNFILGSSLLAKVMKEIQGDDITIGITEDGSIVRISADDLDLFHPTIDKKYMPTADMIEQVTSGERTCHFVVEGRELKDALDRVAPVGKKTTDAHMEFVITAKGAVTLRQSAMANAAQSKLKVKEADAKEALNITVRAQYLKEFVKAAPSSMPLTVESWDEKFLRITVREDPGMIDYLAMMLAD